MWSRSFLLKGLGYSTFAGITLFAMRQEQLRDAEFRKKFPHVKVPERLQYIPGLGMATIKSYPSDEEARYLEEHALRQEKGVGSQFKMK